MRKTVVTLMLLLALAARSPAAEPDDSKLDAAVARALEYLAQTQDRTDGSWHVGRQKHAAVTALCVMAFLSAGYVPGEGRYGDVVEKGVRWLLRQQQPDGRILAPVQEANHEMYHHGICTLMLAEVAGMTRGPLAEDIHKQLPKAVALILKAQRTSGPHRGGWRYRVNNYDGDMSVTGWQVMALRAAKNVGCDVPAERIERAVEYIEKCRQPYTGGFCYMPNGGLTVACTGTGILALEICGKEKHRSAEVLKAGTYLLQHPPRWGGQHFFYSIYYGSQAMFQLGDNYWEVYRSSLHEVLFRSQGYNGAWIGQDGEGRAFGPNYCTAMGVLALTVEYRFLPIYQRDEGK